MTGGEEGSKLLSNSASNPTPETDEVRVRVSMGRAVQDPELGERGEDEGTSAVNIPEEVAEATASAEEVVSSIVPEPEQEVELDMEREEHQEGLQPETNVARVHEFVSDWRIIEKQAKEFKRKREEEIKDGKTNKGDGKWESGNKKEKAKKRKERVVTSTPKEKEVEKGVEADVESKAREDEDNIKRKEGRRRGENTETEKVEKGRRCGRCEACNRKCKVCEEGGKCGQRMRNKGSVGRPECIKPQPPKRKPAGTPGAVSQTLIGRFQGSGKRNMRLRAGSTSGELNPGEGRLLGKPPEGTKFRLQQKGDTVQDAEVARECLEETFPQTPAKPPDKLTRNYDKEGEEIARAENRPGHKDTQNLPHKEGERDKGQDVTREPPFKPSPT